MEKELTAERYQIRSQIPESVREDGILDMETYQRYPENRQYRRWLTETYGKTKLEKVGDYLRTKEGRHDALDAVGLFFEPADLVTASCT